MKRFLALLMVILTSLCLFGCGDDPVPEGMKLASDTDVVDYSLFVPKEWIVSSAERATTHAYVSEGDRTNVLVMQWNITENTKTVSDWWTKEYKPQVFESGSIQDCKVLIEGEQALLDTREAYKYSYTGKIGDTYFRYDIVACVTQGSIYVMQFTYMQDKAEQGKEITFSSVDTHKEAVDKIVDNFRFR